MFLKSILAAVLAATPFAATSAQAGFVQCHKWAAPGSGYIQQAQLWNPSGSGVTLHLKRIFIHSNTTTSWNIIATDTQFTELRNPGHSTDIGPSAASSGEGELRGIVNQDRGEFQVYSLYVWSANGFDQLAREVDITISPGWGLAIAPRDFNMTMAPCFEWDEVAN